METHILGRTSAGSSDLRKLIPERDPGNERVMHRPVAGSALSKNKENWQKADASTEVRTRDRMFTKHALCQPSSSAGHPLARTSGTRPPEPEIRNLPPPAAQDVAAPGKLATRDPKPETRDPRPETRNPRPETRNPKPQIPKLKPAIRNPKPETRNPKPQTLNTLLARRFVLVNCGTNWNGGVVDWMPARIFC